MRIIVFVCAGHRLYQHFGSGPNPNWLNQQFAVQYNGKYHHISLSHSLSLSFSNSLSLSSFKKMSDVCACVAVEWQCDEPEECRGDRRCDREWTNPVLSAIPPPQGGTRSVCASLSGSCTSPQEPHQPVSAFVFTFYMSVSNGHVCGFG